MTKLSAVRCLCFLILADLLPGGISRTQEHLIAVQFLIKAPGAHAVSVVGTFNDWDQDAHPMVLDKDRWVVSLELGEGYYYYRFNVDGEAIPDPFNAWRVGYEQDEVACVLKVGQPETPKRLRYHLPFPKEKIPVPVLEHDSDLVDLYFAAWEIAWHHLFHGTPGNGFSPTYMEEGIDDFIHQWDSIFMGLYTIYAPDVFPTGELADNFYRQQRMDGFICRSYSQDNGAASGEPDTDDPWIHPPLFAWLESRIFQSLADTMRVRDVLPTLVRYHNWLEVHCRSVESRGLYFTTARGSAMENIDRHALGKGIWIDLSGQMALSALNIARLAAVVGDTVTRKEFHQKHGELVRLLNALCWEDRTKWYHDIRADGSIFEMKHLGAFWPMLAGATDTDQGDGMMEHVLSPSEFLRPHPFPVLSADDPQYEARGREWRGGVWPPMNYAVFKSLSQMGYTEFARNIAIQHLRTMRNILRQFHPPAERIAFEERYGDRYQTIWQCYSPETTEPATRWDDTFYSQQDFVGSSGITPIAALIEDVLGITLDAPNNTINWNVVRNDKHGLENLTFRDQKVSFICSPRNDQMWLHVTVERPVTMDVMWKNRRYREEITKPGTTLMILK